MIVAMIRLDAGADRNGNPRRVYVGLNETGGLGGVWDEGYEGMQAVPAVAREHALNACTFKTTPGEYRSLLKLRIV